MDRLRVGLVGVGYWGPNWIRTLLAEPGCDLVAVCDRSPGRLDYVADRFPGVPLTSSYDDLIADPLLDAVIIVTPVATHRALAEQALRAGKHVLVEKPLAAQPDDARALVEAADRAGKVLATGHVFVYHPAIEALRDSLRAGELGRPCYAESGRVNLGPPAAEVSVVWDLAVHDVSIVLSLLGKEPRDVIAEGRRYVHPSLTDVAFITLRFDDGFLSMHHVSWRSSVRVRRFFLAGTHGSATFDDMRDEGKLVLSGLGEDSRLGDGATQAKDLFYAAGELHTPELRAVQPLANECAQFLDCIRTGRTPPADGRAGLAVVRILEAAERSIALGGVPVSLATV